MSKKELGFEVIGKNIFVYEPVISDTYGDSKIIKSAEDKAAEMEDRDSYELEIAAVGPDVTGFEVGEKVLIYNRHVPIFTIHRERYIAILESDIVAKVHKKVEKTKVKA